MKRMVRVGKWEGRPSKAARRTVAAFVADFFKAPTVWTRKERSAYVVVARECATNTEVLEEFRFNRPMGERFRFHETADGVDVDLKESSKQ